MQKWIFFSYLLVRCRHCYDFGRFFSTLMTGAWTKGLEEKAGVLNTTIVIILSGEPAGEAIESLNIWVIFNTIESTFISSRSSDPI